MDSYLDRAMKRQAILERVKSGQSKDYAKVIKSIDRLIKQTLIDLDGEVSELNFRQLNALLKQLKIDQSDIYRAGNALYAGELSKIASISQAQEIIDLKATVDLGGTVLAAFTKKDLYANVLKRPLNANGRLLDTFIKDFSAGEIDRVNSAIRNGHSLGTTNQEMITQLVGTKKANYADGILNTTRRHAEAMVRTSTQHVASSARMETMENNRDVTDRYKFVATLDRRTSTICRSTDGKIFELGKGPVSPLHINCRSREIPVLSSKYDWLTKGKTRSAEGGPVSEKTNYYDWLKRQTKQDQIDALGSKRAKLFRDGGMSTDRFSKLQLDKKFSPLTLDEMKAIEPEAFKNAGL